MCTLNIVLRWTEWGENTLQAVMSQLTISQFLKGFYINNLQTGVCDKWYFKMLPKPFLFFVIKLNYVPLSSLDLVSCITNTLCALHIYWGRVVIWIFVCVYIYNCKGHFPFLVIGSSYFVGVHDSWIRPGAWIQTTRWARYTSQHFLNICLFLLSPPLRPLSPESPLFYT